MSSAVPQIGDQQLAEALRTVRLRTSANRLLEALSAIFSIVLTGLIVCLGLVGTVRPAVLGALALAIVAAAGTAAFVWFSGPNNYQAARLLDAAAGGCDRVSTAEYFWNTPGPSAAILKQRADALEHLRRLEPAKLFPFQLPRRSWQPALLFGVFLAVCAYHAAYGPPLSRLASKAVQSHSFRTLTTPLTRATDFVRNEKKELGELIASSDRSRQADADKNRSSAMSDVNPPQATARSIAKAPVADLSQALQMANSQSDALQGSLSNPSPNSQAAAMAPNSQSSPTSSEQAGQPHQQGSQSSLTERAMQALASLMGASSGNQQNKSDSPPSSQTSAANNAATATQSNDASSKAPGAASQAAQGQTANSESAPNASQGNLGKHTGAGNGTSPWVPRAEQDPQLAAANAAKEHVQLQTTGFRGAPGKDRSDVAPGTAQIPLQNVTPQTVTTINGAGQDSVPTRYRQYVQDYFQHSEK